MAKFCTSCGGALQSGVKFCSQCGTQVENTQRPPKPEVRTLPKTTATVARVNKGPILLWLILAAVGVLAISGLLFYFNRPHTTNKDDFSTERALDPTRWQAGTPLLTTLAEAEGSRYVEPQLSFDRLGMTMAGVNGTFEFTGVQSTLSFSPPFTARAKVKGKISHGNTFGLYVLSNDLRQPLTIEGNLNPQSGYQGLSIGSVKVLRDVGTDQWYTVVVAVDAKGSATVTFNDSDGRPLATKPGLQVGLGPFFIVLGQREGAPLSVGPNEAVWSFAEVTFSSAPVASSSNGNGISDAVIVQNVKAKLFNDESLRKYSIDVRAQDGVVTLAGLVNTIDDKTSAVHIARQQQGVKQVVDQLILSAVNFASEGSVAQNATSSSSGNSTASTVGSPNPVPTAQPTASAGRPAIVQALIQPNSTSIHLQPGRVYLYGMSTGGALPSQSFEKGQFAQAVNASRNIAAALAYGPDDQNEYRTSTYSHEICGVSVGGQWDRFDPFYGSNVERGASSASVTFTVAENSLVVVIGLAGGQTDITLSGVPGLQVDNSNKAAGGETGIVISHALLRSGTYTIVQSSSDTSNSDAESKVDLVGVFVFGFKE